MEPTIHVLGSLYNSIASAANIDWIQVDGSIVPDSNAGHEVFIEAKSALGWLFVDGAMGEAACGYPVHVHAPSIGAIRASAAHLDVGGHVVLPCAGGPWGPDAADIDEVRLNGDFGNAASVFEGFIWASHVNLVEMAGDMKGIIRTENFGPFDTIRIGGSLDFLADCDIGNDVEPAEILCPNGLGGQVIVNAWDDLAQPGQWSGEAKVYLNQGDYTFVLSPSVQQPDHAPLYDRLTVELGGGAVGVVPYRLHDADCVPPNGTSFCEIDGCDERFPCLTWPDGITRQTIVLREYGPITDAWPDDASSPVHLGWAPLSSPCPVEPCGPLYADIPAVVAVRPFDLQREIWVSTENGTFDHKSLYRVVPRRSHDGRTDLRCKGTYLRPGEPCDIADFTYDLAMDQCFDLNANYAVEEGDIVNWVEAPVDLNADETANEADLYMLIEAILTP